MVVMKLLISQSAGRENMETRRRESVITLNRAKIRLGLVVLFRYSPGPGVIRWLDPFLGGCRMFGADLRKEDDTKSPGHANIILPEDGPSFV